MDRVNVTASILLKCGPIFGVWRLHIQIQVQLKDGAVQGNEKQDHLRTAILQGSAKISHDPTASDALPWTLGMVLQ